MMKSLIIGFIFAIGVVLVSIESSFSTFMQIHSIVIVFAGTLAIFIASTPFNLVSELFRNIRLMATQESKFTDLTQDLVALSNNRQLETNQDNELIKYAQKLWRQGVEPQLASALILQKLREIENKTAYSTQILKNLVKYPPALGMTGTVIGMVALFVNLDSNKSQIGENLALAMTATFFGLILSNFIISPLADRMQIFQVNRSILHDRVAQILLLINNNETSAIIEGKLEQDVA
jgi:chemotaxis protein MotA